MTKKAQRYISPASAARRTARLSYSKHDAERRTLSTLVYTVAVSCYSLLIVDRERVCNDIVCRSAMTERQGDRTDVDINNNNGFVIVYSP